jgi:chemotaxis protein MotB
VTFYEFINYDGLLKNQKRLGHGTEKQEVITFPPSVPRLFTTPTIMDQKKNSKDPISASNSMNNAELLMRAGKIGPHGESRPVFVVDDTFFRSRTPKSTHWSIAWSDLMMTMFILFLTLFVYQLAHREFLSEKSPEVVAGTTMVVQEPATTPLPFHPISPVISQKKANQLKKLKPEVKKRNEDEIDAMFEGTDKPVVSPSQPAIKNSEVPAKSEMNKPKSDRTPESIAQEKSKATAKQASPLQKEITPAVIPVPDTIITRMYDLSKVTLISEKLEKFASVELIPDKTMRIVLTGDLLFPSGKAELTNQAKESLLKLMPVFNQTPYMINVIGHTDSIPMHSEKFASNWELSTARAGSVARFLIEEGHIPATQFVVTGYSYFRPVKPNTTAANRKANRRVEIILSKEPPPAQSANKSNIQ